MSAICIALLACALMLGGAIGGAQLRKSLPEHHLDAHAKDVVRLGASLVATISGLLLGLLISSASGSLSAQRLEVKQMAGNIILLHQMLTRYGPETQEARELLSSSIGPLTEEIWGKDGSSAPREQTLQRNAAGVRLFMVLHELSPRNDTQASIRSQAIQIMVDVAKARFALFEQADSALPVPFLVILIFWLTALFVSFSLFSPLNPTSVGALLVIAISASGALYLILEMSQPFSGLMQIPRSTLANTLTAFGG